MVVDGEINGDIGEGTDERDYKVIEPIFSDSSFYDLYLMCIG